MALSDLAVAKDERLLVGFEGAEDATVVTFPPGKALVQTVDFLTPIIDDPFLFGQIAACNSLSDVYAMAATPYTAMNIVCFPDQTFPMSVLQDILRGGLSKIEESGALLVGGHSVRDPELKYGLSVTGIVDPLNIAKNSSLQPGDVLILTKPIGSGILGTAIKGRWDKYTQYEEEIAHWLTKLNNIAAQALTVFNVQACTDITGFGLVGHVLEMAMASHCLVRLSAKDVPLMIDAYELASIGLVSGGSFSNKKHCTSLVEAQDVDPILEDILYDPQTSGGLVMGVAPDQAPAVRQWLQDHDELAAIIGTVEAAGQSCTRVLIS